MSSGLQYLVVIAFGWLVLAATTTASIVFPRYRSLRASQLSVFLGSVLLAALSLLTLMSLRARVFLSEVWLDRAVVEAQRTRFGAAAGPRRVGLFEIQRQLSTDDEVYLSTGACGLFCEAGLLYRRTGSGPLPKNVYAEHLYGPWWQFVIQDD